MVERPGACDGKDGPIPCEEALSRLYEYLDGELEDVTPDEVERHFRVCAACYPHLVCEQAFREALQRALGGAGCPEELRRRLQEALEGE